VFARLELVGTNEVMVVKQTIRRLSKPLVVVASLQSHPNIAWFVSRHCCLVAEFQEMPEQMLYKNSF
jgi:hypothetical protein